MPVEITELSSDKTIDIIPDSDIQSVIRSLEERGYIQASSRCFVKGGDWVEVNEDLST